MREASDVLARDKRAFVVIAALDDLRLIDIIRLAVLHDELVQPLPALPELDIARKRLLVDGGENANRIQVRREASPDAFGLRIEFARHRGHGGEHLRLVWARFG